MAKPSINGQAVAPQRAPELISRTAILILSSVSIGTAIGHGALTGVYAICFYAGIVGLISFVGLDVVAAKGRQRIAHKALASAQLRLSSRIDRHLSPRALGSGPSVRRRRSYSESSYLTVATR